MRLENLPVGESAGAILVHNVVGPDGHKVLSKGHLLRPEDLDKIRALGRETVYVGIPDPGDVREDAAAGRLAEGLAGEGIDAGKPNSGRVNFFAARPGFLQVNRIALDQINELAGVTLATIARYTPLRPKKMIATLKTVGLAIPETTLQRAREIMDREGAVLSLSPVKHHLAAIVFTGSENGRARVQEIFGPPIRGRLTELGAQVIAESYAVEEVDAIAHAIRAALAAGAQILVLAGETSIMDEEDITPRAIRSAGGEIELYGAPVEPGNLLLLAYCGGVPIVGAPGCVKSRETNVVDLILPRLVAGDRVASEDINALAEGGLLLG